MQWAYMQAFTSRFILVDTAAKTTGLFVSSRTRFCRAMAGKASARLNSEGPPTSIQSAQLGTSSQEIFADISSETVAESDSARQLHTLADSRQADKQELNQDSSRNGDVSEFPRKGHVWTVREGRETAKFQLKNSCILALQRGDITKWRVDGQTDAIVNAANTRMLGGGGVDGAIHRAAGPDLYQACLKLPRVGKNIRCQTGDAVITEAYRLPVSKIVHTVGPEYDNDEKSGPLLGSSYKNSLVLAEKSGIQYLAFPAISCGIYGYPYDKAAEISLDTVSKHSAGLKEVHFVLFEEGSWVEWLEKACKSFERLDEETT